MTGLPVIVGFGGYNAAGRSSFHQAYQRTVIESISPQKRQETLLGLATMMGYLSYKDGAYSDAGGHVVNADQLNKSLVQDILSNTLVRRISTTYFDVDQVSNHQKISFDPTSNQTLSFYLTKKQLPAAIPPQWQVTAEDNGKYKVTLEGDADFFVRANHRAAVQTAGQLPEGFSPSDHYSSRFHPRGLQLSILGASDAVNSMGIAWEKVLEHVAPDQVGVYSTSVMSQLDQNGLGGLLQARLKGERPTTKQLALGLNSMPADFVNAYVLGSLGVTSSVTGACASFLYNLQAAVEDIRSGRRRVVIVGSSEAPITSEVIEGYATMGALATVEKLCKLDGVDTPDYARSSRPFGDNCGFTIAESTQQVVLMDDALAMELGASIYGSVLGVFINADGYKKSISAPGPGNYLTFAKAVAGAEQLLGADAIRHRSFIQAHGSSTPQNRVTESAIFDRIARLYDVNQWPVTAVKAYVGHSIAAASGDQLINALGTFAHGIIPGIKTIDKVADDVLQQRLQIATRDTPCEQAPEVAFLNSKGFGGNNATASILSPERTQVMLAKRYGDKAVAQYWQSNETTVELAHQYHQTALQGDLQVRYRFGEGMIDDEQIEISKSHISVPGFGQSIDLANENLYKDMLE